MGSTFAIASMVSLVLIAVALGLLLFREKKRRKEFEARLSERASTNDSSLITKAKFSELGVMSAAIAHEFSNSLSIIQMSSEQLLRQYRLPDSEKFLAEGLGKIKYNTERMGKVIKVIRELIYQDESVEETILLDDLLENVFLFYGQRLKNHKIETRLINTENVYLYGNKVQLEQAFLNLVSNATDAIDTLDEKWIEICVVEIDDAIDIYVRDSGLGIPVNIGAKIMEPFFTTKKAHGTGLGLPLVKGIARKHGGDLYYIDRAPHTTFLLELPKAKKI